MNDRERGSRTPGSGFAGDHRDDLDGRLSRRTLLWLLGGTAGASVLGTRLWTGVASAGESAVSPTIPQPSVPGPELVPPDVPTAAELAANLEWDVDKMFRYVADEVQYDPYAGALRGSVGTLWGMAGNSVDQALLLASLLDEALVPYRFAIGEVDEATSAKLVAAA